DIAQYYIEPANYAATPNNQPPTPNDPPTTETHQTVQTNSTNQTTPTYHPHILGMATVTFDDRKTGTRHAITFTHLLAPNDNPRALDWATSEALTLERNALQSTPTQAAPYAELPAGLGNPKTLAALEKAFAQYLYREAALVLRKNPTLKVVEAPNEND